MNHLLKITVKFAIGTCFTLGAVAVAASAVADSNIGKIVSAGFRGAKDAVDAELAAQKTDTVSNEESTMFADVEEISSEKIEAAPVNAEN